MGEGDLADLIFSLGTLMGASTLTYMAHRKEQPKPVFADYGIDFFQPKSGSVAQIMLGNVRPRLASSFFSSALLDYFLESKVAQPTDFCYPDLDGVKLGKFRPKLEHKFPQITQIHRLYDEFGFKAVKL